jgi:hypothetical protein
VANLIGGIAPYLEVNNRIVGTADRGIIFGDPYTTGNDLGVREIGGLLAGQSGDGQLKVLGGSDSLFGDVWTTAYGGKSGNDRLEGGLG